MGKKRKPEKKSKSGSPETTLIVALVSSILFFLLGVMVGKEYAIREGSVAVSTRSGTLPPVPTAPPSPEATKDKGGRKVDITFYDQLMKSGDVELNRRINGGRKSKTKPAVPRPPVKKPHEKAGSSTGEPSTPSLKKVTSTSEGDYALQVAAFRNRELALKMVRALEREGFHAHLLKGTFPNRGGTFYRVWVGYYRNLDAAAHARRTLLQLKRVKITRAILVKR